MEPVLKLLVSMLLMFTGYFNITIKKTSYCIFKLSEMNLTSFYLLLVSRDISRAAEMGD